MSTGNIRKTEDRVIGVVGGMGPQSGIALINRITSNTQAASDQEHLSTILMSFPGHIVDRTLFLEGQVNVNPAFQITKVIEKLENAGAGIVGIACNTSHAPSIFDTITNELEKSGSQVELLHMPFETSRYIKAKHPNVTRVGVMTTNGTYRAGIYSRLLDEWGYQVIVPDQEFQHNVIHRMVYDPRFGIKASPSGIITQEVLSLLNKAVCYFRARRAEVVILGCTELSLIPAEEFADGPFIVDSTETMACALIRQAVAGHPRHSHLLK